MKNNARPMACLCLAWMVTGAMAGLGECGGYLRVKEASIPPSGIITSPNYPNNYGAFTNCIWLIEADQGKTIDMTVDFVQGEAGPDGECIDFLEIRSGSVQSGLLMKTCNTTISRNATTDGSFLWIHFYSDSTNHFSGFSLTWRWNDQSGTQVSSPVKGCPETMFKCANKECVSWSYVCDGDNDCGCYGPGDEDHGQCHKLEMDKDIKLAIGISVGSGILITIVVIVGIWERIQQEKRRQINAKFERKPVKKSEYNFLQTQLKIRRQTVTEQSSPKVKERRNAFVLGIDPNINDDDAPIPDDWKEGIEMETQPRPSPKLPQSTPAKQVVIAEQKTEPNRPESRPTKLPPLKSSEKSSPAKVNSPAKVKIEKPKVIRTMSRAKRVDSGKKTPTGGKGKDESPTRTGKMQGSEEENEDDVFV